MKQRQGLDDQVSELLEERPEALARHERWSNKKLVHELLQEFRREEGRVERQNALHDQAKSVSYEKTLDTYIDHLSDTRGLALDVPKRKMLGELVTDYKAWRSKYDVKAARLPGETLGIYEDVEYWNVALAIGLCGGFVAALFMGVLGAGPGWWWGLGGVEGLIFGGPLVAYAIAKPKLEIERAHSFRWMKRDIAEKLTRYDQRGVKG